MKKVILAYASESDAIVPRINGFYDTLKGNVEFLSPGTATPASAGQPNWILQSAKKADFLVIVFAVPGDPGSVAGLQPGASLNPVERFRR